MHKSRPAFVILVSFSALLYMAPAHADWTRFRGPNGSGISTESTAIPLRWSPTANVKWKTELPGPGVSCPIVAGDRIYVTCYSGYGLDRSNPGDQKDLKRHLLCIDRSSGKLLWSKTVEPALPEDPFSGPGVPAHGYASHTPVADNDGVYVFFGKTGALAFDRDGKQRWQTNLGKESDPSKWGSASSPILYKNLLIVPATAESEALVALDKRTGKEVWRQEAAGFGNSWSTPILVEVDEDRTDLVMSVANEIWGLNPQTGQLRWFCEGLNNRTINTSVVVDDGVMYAIGGQRGKSVAIRVGGKGNVTKSHVVWTGSDTSSFSSPIVRDGRMYSISGSIATVIDVKTGERLDRFRLKGGRSGGGGRMGGDYSSPIMVGDKLLYLSTAGDMFVLSTGDKVEQVAVNRVTEDGEQFAATPAVSHGELFIRSNKHLYCIASLGETVSGPAIPEPSAAAVAAETNARRGRGGGERRGGRRGGFDPAQMFERSDANKDGKLSREELPERLRDRMERLDTDKDGSVTLEEFRANIRQAFGGGRRGGGGRGDRNPREGKPDRPKRPKLEP